MTDVRIIYLHEAVLRRVPRIFSGGPTKITHKRYRRFDAAIYGRQ